MSEDKWAMHNSNKNLFENSFGNYFHDTECMDLAKQLENVQNEILTNIALNKL